MVNENIIPKTETVYELKERNYEIKTSKLSLAARSKIIKKHGSDYLSERAFINDIALMEMYGPGFWSWAGKVAITTTAGIVLGPAAIPVGAAVWGGSKIAEECCDDEDAKKVFGYIADCGSGTFTGGVVGVAAQGVGAVAGFEKFAGLGKNTGNCIASAKHGIKVAGTIEFWTSKGFEAKDAAWHVSHKLAGINYDSDCAVCKS